MNLVGSPIDFFIAFAAGVVMSFTPCIYPLVPITVGYIGGLSGGSRLKGFAHSLLFALGIAVMYAFLGIVASLTGSLFGQFSNNPWPNFIVGNLCIIFGLIFLDVLPAPMFALKVNTQRKKGFLSTFLLGLVFGLVAGSCICPMMGSILAIIATRQNVLYGSTLMFCFSIGFSTLLIIAGTFSSLLVNLPKPGKWMERFKKISGFILIATGEYFLIQAGSHWIQ